MRYFAIFTLGLLLAACSACQKADTAASAQPTSSDRIMAIAPADPTKYQSMKDMKNWRNPYLILLPNGVGLLDPADNEQRHLKPDEVLDALAALPASAWPYGRVVVVTESPLADSEEQRVAIRRVKGIVAGTLQSAHVVINWVPSA